MLLSKILLAVTLCYFSLLIGQGASAQTIPDQYSLVKLSSTDDVHHSDQVNTKIIDYSDLGPVIVIINTTEDTSETHVSSKLNGFELWKPVDHRFTPKYQQGVSRFEQSVPAWMHRMIDARGIPISIGDHDYVLGEKGFETKF